MIIDVKTLYAAQGNAYNFRSSDFCADDDDRLTRPIALLWRILPENVWTENHAHQLESSLLLVTACNNEADMVDY